MDVSLRERGVFAFGPFELDPTRRTLRQNGCEVPLTARLFDTLLYLVQHPDRLVTRDELESAVWGGRAVESGNLQKAISSLRKALQGGEELIVTVPGRGFRFAAPVAFEPEAVEAFGHGLTGSSDSAVRQRRRWRRMGAGLVALALAVAGGAVWYFAGRPAGFAPPPHSVAVMAFSNLSGDPGQEYFSDGLSEELIDSLGRVGTIRVAARLSAFSFKGKPATVADIGRLLNVGSVLEGSVRRDGKRLRVTAQLIDAASGYQIWSRSFDRDEGDIFKVQDEIAEAVTSSLQVTLLGDTISTKIVGGTTNPKAFDAYLRGLALQTSSDESLSNASEAVAAFDAAIALDPNYAIAHAGRAYSLADLMETAPTSDHALQLKYQAEAMAAARRAVAIAPELGRAHAALAYILEDSFDFAGAEAEYTRAMELAPGRAWILMPYGELQMYLGHTDRALEVVKQAASLDSLSPDIYVELAWTYWQARQYGDALGALRHWQQVAPAGTPRPLGEQGLIEVMNHDPMAAQRDCAQGNDLVQRICLAIAYHALGKPNDAAAQVEKIRAEYGENAASNYVQIYAQWGETATALHWLRVAYDLRDPGLKFINVDPTLDPIRDTPAFRDVVRQMNFPP